MILKSNTEETGSDKIWQGFSVCIRRKIYEADYTGKKPGITVPQNAFGALPIQRVSKEMAVKLLRRAYEGGMRFFGYGQSLQRQ